MHIPISKLSVYMFWAMLLSIHVFQYQTFVKWSQTFCVALPSAKSVNQMASILVTFSDKTGTGSWWMQMEELLLISVGTGTRLLPQPSSSPAMQKGDFGSHRASDGKENQITVFSVVKIKQNQINQQIRAWKPRNSKNLLKNPAL